MGAYIIAAFVEFTSYGQEPNTPKELRLLAQGCTRAGYPWNTQFVSVSFLICLFETRQARRMEC